MISNESKTRVAESCPEYNSKRTMFSDNLSYLAHNCTNCLNHVNGMCTKNLFESLWSQISIN